MSRDSEIALALVASLDDRALDLLAEALAPRLEVDSAPSPVVYTVATLALELGVSERAIRAAIQRGELDAVKRGRTYLITRAAVEGWPGLLDEPGRGLQAVQQPQSRSFAGGRGYEVALRAVCA